MSLLMNRGRKKPKPTASQELKSAKGSTKETSEKEPETQEKGSGTQDKPGSLFSKKRGRPKKQA